MPAKAFRFDDFELDRVAFELRRTGRAVPLERIPLELLFLLVERRGELVTRQEILDRVWGKHVFVDADNAINTAVRKIRLALRDNPENPRFLHTVPAKGYRFDAQILQGPSADSLIAAPLPPPSAAVGVRPQQRRLALWIALPVAGLVFWWYGQPKLPVATNTVRITNDEMAKNAFNLPVTDGVRLYFIEGAPWTSGSGIMQTSASGGATTRIATTLKEVLAIYAISPDRSELLVGNGVGASTDLKTGRSEGAAELWVQPLLGGTPRRIGNLYASAACWTPDGLHIMYADGRAILMANQDGSEPRELAKVQGVVRGLRFSPDGLRIRFYIIRPPGFDSSSIWELDANGKSLHELFADWKQSPYQCCGNWSPDGDYYYFQTGRGSEQAIWVMPERRSILGRAATGPSQLMSGPLRFSSPVPSGDGKRLFVVGEEPRIELLRYDLPMRRFSPYFEGLSAGPFDFSPDRKWIAYVSYPEMTLWRSRTDGSDKRQLTFPPMRTFQPRWSPDGSKIVFLDVQFYRPWRIRLVSSAGGAPELLMKASDDEVQADPTWTPDGKIIFFGKSKGTHKMGIYRLDLSSGQATLVPDSDGLFSPRVSPDGRYLSAFATGQTRLMLFDISTNHWSMLREGEELNYNEWTHDGKYVYMRSNYGGAAELVRVRIADGRLERVVSLKDIPQVVEMFAGWIGLTPDDAPVLMRDRSVQEIYGLELRFR